MPRGNYNRPYQPPFDPTITQSIETALRDAGRDDLVDALRKAGMRELEEELHRAKERIKALELERVNWLTESGMFKALDDRAGKIVVDWLKRLGKKVSQALMASVWLGLVSLVIWIAKLLWKGWHVK